MKLPWNFSRPGPAWVMNRQGVYVERGADEPRYQWTPEGRSGGLLIERAGINRFTLADKATADYGFLSPSSGFFYDAESILPGSLLTRSIGKPAGSSASLYDTSFMVPEGETAYLQAVIRMDDGSAVTNEMYGIGDDLFRVIIGNGTASTSNTQIIPLGGGVYLLRALHTPLATSNRDRSGLAFGVNFPPCKVQIFQMELGGFSSPIKSAGIAATRPADTLYADMSLVPGFDPTKGTVVVEWDDIGLVGQPFQVSQTASENPTDGDYWRLSRSTVTGRLRLLLKSVSGSSRYTSFSGDLGPRSRAAVRWEGENFGFALDGSMVGTLVYDAGPLSGLRFLRIGQDTHALYRHVQYIPQAVSDAQLQQLSSLNP